MFAYSMRARTHAYHRMEDNVPADIKQKRLEQVIEAFRTSLCVLQDREIGRYHLVLVEVRSFKWVKLFPLNEFKFTSSI